MSTTDKKQGINYYWREFGYDSDYEPSLDKNKDNNSEEEQEEEENQYEEIENNGEEEYNLEEEMAYGNQYEEEYEEMEGQINYADNIPKLEHSFDAESKNRLQLPSRVDESELNPFNMSICGPRYKKLHTCNKDCYNKNCLNDGKIIYAYGIGLGEPKGKLNRTVEVLKREFNREPKVSIQENNIISAKTYSELIEELNKIDDDLHAQLQERITRDKTRSNLYKELDEASTELKSKAAQKIYDLADAKTDNIELTRKQENSDNLDHGWQYFNKYGKDDYRTIKKLGDEIRLYWEGIPENSRQNALNAYISDNTTEMNNIMNENFAQVF